MLEEIRTFVAVARSKSFSMAAEKLSISTSVVTRRIQFLETELDEILIHRTTRQLSLTSAGTLFYENCIRILDTFDNSKKNLQNLKNPLSGTLKIGIPLSICHLCITPYLNPFLKDHPHLKINIVNGNHLIDLLEDHFDLIIHCGSLPNSNFYYRKLGTWQLTAVASPSYLKQYGTPKTPDDLNKFNCLDHYDNYDNSWPFLIKEKEKKIFVNGNIRVNSNIILKNLAISDTGICYIPSFTIAPELKNGILVEVLKEYKMKSLEICALYPKDSISNQKAQAFLAFLENCFSIKNSGIEKN